MKEKIAQLKTALTGGVAPAMASPLTADGAYIDKTAVRPLVNMLADAGVSGIFVGGTTGEGILLDLNNRKELHEAAVSAARRRDEHLPVLLHVGANHTRAALHLAKHAAVTGADAIVAITPYFFGMDDDALFDYYCRLAGTVPDTPFLLYDIPHLAGNGISPSLLKRLADALPNLAGIKCSRPDAQAIRALIDAAPPEVCVLAGNERIALGSLALGAHGLISGLSTAVPEPFVALTAAHQAGKNMQARAIQKRINQLLDVLPAGKRIGAIKRILAERGVAVGPAVPPRATPDEEIWPAMADILDLPV